ncbi:MAG: 4Fe-4S dicluster domain-containing protein [Desulfobacterales bacterium]|jgi:formate dehydrogenase iron-sulfur subunit
MGFGMFIDTTRCVACKACQVACKAWNRLPAEQTENYGNLQNPPDLSYTTYKLVRMREQIIDGKLHWLFFPDQCRHCIAAPCLLWARNTEAIYQDKETGAVVFTQKTRDLNAAEISRVCPYNVPRSGQSGELAKCTLCNNRLKEGLEPACVKACPTDCLNFGELADMRKMALQRVNKVKLTYPNARLLDPDNVRVIFLTAFSPNQYHDYAASFDPTIWQPQ